MNANLNENSNPAIHEDQPSKGKGFVWSTAILGVGLAGALGIAAYEHSDAVNTKMEVAQLQREVVSLRQSANQTDSQLLETLNALRTDLDSTKRETAQNTQKASAALQRQAQILTSRLAKRQEEQSKVLTAQIDQVKTTAEQATAKLTDITTEVGSVKTDVASTRSDLDRTTNDLKRTLGDMGVMSDRIATNATELQALRELGQRDYVEFTLNKAQKTARVGDITVALRKADPKRNRFTVDITADDKKVEKKDRGVNEPVQFYVASKARQPYELVVNDVKKDTIVGYVSMPKVKLTAQR